MGLEQVQVLCKWSLQAPFLGARVTHLQQRMARGWTPAPLPKVPLFKRPSAERPMPREGQFANPACGLVVLRDDGERLYVGGVL